MVSARQAFYKSDKWEAFRENLIAERTEADGTLRCAHCGNAITHKYDAIAHHIEELTDENVADAMVALNPDNIEIICFKCHNEAHHRFGSKVYKRVYIVHGAPFAGKEDYVNSIADTDDLIVNIERLWTAVKCNRLPDYTKPDALKAIVFGLRDKLYADIQYRRGKWATAYVIATLPMVGERERLADMLGAELIHIDTDKETCLMNAAEKNFSDSAKWITKYFEEYSE
jgi:hypothetical protein